METTPTFVSHTGNGVSQIDYILCTDVQILNSTIVTENHYLSQSAHTVVSFTLDVKVDLLINKGKSNKQSKAVSKLIWEKLNVGKFQDVLSNELKSLNEEHLRDTDELLGFVQNSLKAAAYKSVPSRTIKL